MTSPSHSSPDPNQNTDSKQPANRTHTPRPDELSSETLQFITAVDNYKRKHLRSFLDDSEVLEITLGLGYRLIDGKDEVTTQQLAAYVAARKRYREDEGRLFPTWSEVFKILSKLGYSRQRAA